MRIYAIGDVHGRADLLRTMYAKIAAEIREVPPRDCRVIHIGDYCDRGPDTRGVFDLLIERMKNPRIIALAGNHDAGFLDFLKEPLPEGLFVRNGGAETARSYGVEADFSSATGCWQTCLVLRNAVPPDHQHFLAALPRKVAFGDYFFCHAGVRPGVPLESQSGEDLIWIRREFLEEPMLYEKVIVHGHTPRGSAEVMPNRINVDTGAWESGILTSVVLEDDTVRLIDVRG